MTVVYLARHADPDRTTGVPYQTWPGPGLTQQGRVEAMQLGRVMASLGIEYVWHSPMLRTHMTAALALEGIKGSYSSLSREDTRLTESQPGESIERIRARMESVFSDACIATNGDGRRLVLIGHGGPIAVLLDAMGMPDSDLIGHMSRYDNGSPLPTAGLMRCDLESDGAWKFTLEFDPRFPGELADVANGVPLRPF